MSVEKSKDDLVREWNEAVEEKEKRILMEQIRQKAEELKKKSPIDQIFDKLIGREHLILEALGFINDKCEWKSLAVHELLCGQIRNAQDELKKQYKIK